MFNLLQKKEVAEGPSEIKIVYETIWKVIKTPRMFFLLLFLFFLFFVDMKKFIVILMLAKIGFIANESVTGLKLLELGFQKEDLALAV
jgi:PAT family acetyl-CoA transporter-like MFS transporter 1